MGNTYDYSKATVGIRIKCIKPFIEKNHKKMKTMKTLRNCDPKQRIPKPISPTLHVAPNIPQAFARNNEPTKKVTLEGGIPPSPPGRNIKDEYVVFSRAVS